MNSIISSNTPSMTSLEIAELVGSRHDSVKRTIETLAKRGVIVLPPVGIFESINNLGLPQKTKLYVFSGEQGKRDSLVVVAQLSPEFTGRLVDRWQELERAITTVSENSETMAIPYMPEEKAAACISAWQKVAAMIGTPESVAIVEGVKAAETAYGVDFTPLLARSSKMDNILPDDVMLEPTELGERLGMGGVQMNLMLKSLGLQYRDNGQWVPTDKGKQYSSPHQWKSEHGSKSGYNLKWRLEDIRRMMK